MQDANQQLRPVCFMVMPFREKPVGEPKGPDAPTVIDCDALWDKAFHPAIVELGYVPIRADYDRGTVIVKDMLERLAFADLVLADVSLPSGNVYYEVGVRHVARETNCVLLAATWSRQLFDIDQFRSIRYRLTDGSVPDDQADLIRRLLVEKVPELMGSKTPYHEFIGEEEEELKRKGVFRDFAERLSAFQALVRAARLISDSHDRKDRVIQLRDDFAGTALEIPDVAIELLCLIRDELGWEETVAFVDSLPDSTRALSFVREQYLLALSNSGEPLQAIAQLEEFMASYGETPERHGIIGGRYKRLWRAERDRRKNEHATRPTRHEEQYLDRAINHYAKGMKLDYNQYYCSSNLPPLLRERGWENDEEQATIVDHFVIAACERALSRGEADEWLRPTLLGAAFRAGNAKKAAELAREVRREGPSTWKLESTLSDLADAVAQTDDEGVRGALQEVYDKLKTLVENQAP